MITRTLFFGEGLFETIRWKPSEEKLKLHYRRLSTSAEFLGIPCPSYEEFLRDLQDMAKEGNDLYLKYVLLSKGGENLTDSAQSYGKLVVVKPLKPLPQRVRLCISPYRRHSSDPVCRHKTTSYLFNLLVKKHALSRGFWDAIILNEKGYICETSTANLLFVKGSRLYTPARGNGLLWGTALEFLSRRLEVKEEYIKDPRNYNGIFVLNSLLLCAVVEEFEGEELRIDKEAFEEISCILRACLLPPQGASPPDR